MGCVRSLARARVHTNAHVPLPERSVICVNSRFNDKCVEASIFSESRLLETISESDHCLSQCDGTPGIVFLNNKTFLPIVRPVCYVKNCAFYGFDYSPESRIALH